jgi:murein DD-endopeptidase MepM/ murein hydrolase activator NlpD
VALSAALGACSYIDGGRRPGTIEYPGSAAGPNAAAVYVVKDKDTVSSVANRFGVSSQTIVSRNRLQPPYSLREGQTLEIPGARVVASSEPPPTQAAAANAPGSVKKDALPPPGASPPATEAAAPPPAPPPARTGPAPGTPTPLSPPAKDKEAAVAPAPSPRFAWPVRGKVVSPYGTSGGQRNDGIDIQAEKGATVQAADGGKVVYAGSEVKNMGNLLLVDHGGGYITAYGYNEQLLVKKGDTVKKGQAIAKVGTSGSATDPRLHFEVRRQSKPIDPTTVLPGQ